MKLLVKVSLAILVVALGAGVILFLTTMVATRVALQRSVRDNQVDTARHTMDKIDRLLYERQKELEAVVSVGVFTMEANSEARASYLLGQLTVSTGPWDRLHLVRRDGTILASSRPQVIGASLGQDEAVVSTAAQAFAGATASSDWVLSGETHRPTVVFATPVWDDRQIGRPVVGALVGLFSWPAVSEILDEVEAHAVLLNAQGAPIDENRHYESPGTAVTHVLETHALRPAVLAHRVQSAIALDRQSFLPTEALVSFVPQQGFLAYRGHQWGLMLETPTRVAFAAAKNGALVNALLLLPVTLIGSLLILWLVARLVIRPVTELTEITRAVAQGDVSRRASVRSKDELGELATAFNTMIHTIQESHELLEGKVHERTQALSETNRALAASNKELDDFTYIVSHDLKEPLRSIDAFSRFALDEHGAQLGDEGRGYLERVRANAKRMQRLIEDLLEISRLSRRPNELQRVDLNPILEDVKLRFEHVLTERHVQIVVPQPLPTLICDRVRIAEVFANLISNAIKYNDKPACRIEIGWRAVPGAHQFSIADNGPGIEPEYFEKIFQIFQRLGKKEEQEGTGVGLTIVKKVVERHHGRVWVESAPGQGTTFHFTIPTDEAMLRNTPAQENTT